MFTFVQPTQAYKTFIQNADNFRTSDQLRNDRINASAGLAEQLGYSAQQFARLKTFAEQQWMNYDAMEFPDERSFVFLENQDGMYIISPWVDDGGSTEMLKDIGAINCYGMDFIREWCKKADDAMK